MNKGLKTFLIVGGIAGGSIVAYRGILLLELTNKIQIIPQNTIRDGKYVVKVEVINPTGGQAKIIKPHVRVFRKDSVEPIAISDVSNEVVTINPNGKASFDLVMRITDFGTTIQEGISIITDFLAGSIDVRVEVFTSLSFFGSVIPLPKVTVETGLPNIFARNTGINGVSRQPLSQTQRLLLAV